MHCHVFSMNYKGCGGEGREWNGTSTFMARLEREYTSKDRAFILGEEYSFS